MKKTAAFFIILIISLSFARNTFASAELAKNGDFELLADESRLPAEWYFEAWLAEETDTLVETMELPNKGFVVHIINYVENDSRLCLSIECEPDTIYKISCDIKTENTEGGAGANISVVDSLAASTAVLGTTDWHRIELVGKTGTDQNRLTVAVRLGGYGALSAGEAWFDHVSIEKLPDAAGGTLADFSKAENSGRIAYDPGEMPYFGAILLAGFFTALVYLLLLRKKIEFAQLSAYSSDRAQKIIFILMAAFVVRCAASFIFVGHPTDIACFGGWANAMAEAGPSGFYTSGIFADYPPGYMYFLWLIGEFSSMLELSYGSAGFVLLLKVPAIVADLAVSYLIYRIAEKRLSERMAFILMSVAAFNPAALFISGGWGQIDSLLTLLLIVSILFFINGKTILAAAVYGLAVLVKPQALMAGPLLALAYFIAIADKKMTLLKTVLAVLSSFSVIILLSLPFFKGQEPAWLLGKYFSTATSYPYASIEAFNLHSLFGGNWKPVGETMLLFSHGTWGTIFILCSLLYTGFLYIKGRKSEPNSLLLAAAFLLTALFTLGQYMHERYIFPALAMILLSFIYYRDKRLFVVFSVFSVTLLLNTLAAFVIVGHADARGLQYDILTYGVSLLEVGAFGYFAYTCTDILVKKKIRPAFLQQNGDEAVPEPAGSSLDDNHKERFQKRDHIYCWTLTVVYSIIAILNLGSLQAPQTYWRSGTGDENIRISFSETVTVHEIRMFGGISEGTMLLTGDDGTEIEFDQINGDMFRWVRIDGGFTAKEAVLSVIRGELWINEIAFFDTDGNYIPAAVIGGTGEYIIDEPDQVPVLPSYLNGMYFDELYHARTAFEHLHGLEPYENSHPPLGKIFIMLGISVFGMNPFGWRISGTLFGIGMVPILYIFGKRLFKKSEYALLTAFLLAFDFMHFTQTRIATIDVYGVFFIILMYYFMYRYYCLSFFTDGLKNTLKPLGMAGLFFGLGAASKWIGFYAGAGLAVILFTSLAQRFSEYRKGKADAASFRKNTIITLLFCCVFFIAIPAAIYLASYVPYVFSESHYDLAGIWGVQEFMFNYHSTLQATHSFQSGWWEWPLIIRPIWYYWNSFLPAEKVSTIASFGNPAVWWTCTVCTLIFIYRLLIRKIRMQRGIFITFVGIGANLLPWVLVTRCTFIYHFFATVPFIIICSVYALKNLDEKAGRVAWIKWVWMGLVLLLFIIFYPAISGLEISRDYAISLHWLPSWYFVSGV